MNKMVIDNVYVEETNEWSFPTVDVLKKNSYQITLNTKDENVLTQDDLKNLQIEIQKNKEILNAKAEIENLKIDVEKKMELINSLLKKFEYPLASIDKEIVELIEYIIKKSVKNIIYKEMKSDARLVNRVIKELSQLIHSQNGLITVYLSEIDYKKMSMEASDEKVVLKINPALTEGDMILKSNYTEIRAILDDRINQLLGIKYA
ncbi:MAG: FliH/SctL family protein [Gammaproteobacteria bacterium]